MPHPCLHGSAVGCLMKSDGREGSEIVCLSEQVATITYIAQIQFCKGSLTNCLQVSVQIGNLSMEGESTNVQICAPISKHK